MTNFRSHSLRYTSAYTQIIGSTRSPIPDFCKSFVCIRRNISSQMTIFKCGHRLLIIFATFRTCDRNSSSLPLPLHRAHSPMRNTSSQPICKCEKLGDSNSSTSITSTSGSLDVVGNDVVWCKSITCAIISSMKASDAFWLGQIDCGDSGTSRKCWKSCNFNANSRCANVCISGMTERPTDAAAWRSSFRSPVE